MDSSFVKGVKNNVACFFSHRTKGNTEEIDTIGESYARQISINHNDFKIFKSHESQLYQVLWHKFGCMSTLVLPALKDHPSTLPVFRKTLVLGVEVSVWNDDLTRHAADAVVNAANEDLMHGGGLALALVRAGGHEIQVESRSLIARLGKVPTGQIAITGAGRLPYKLIIHAVGPQWTKGNEKRCIEQLKMAITNILDFVIYKNPHIKVVAIPAISSGIFNFPLDLCTCIIVETIMLYLQKKQEVYNLKEIHLVSNEDRTVAAFTTASEAILGRSELESWAFSAEMAKNKPTLSGLGDFGVSQRSGEKKRENQLRGNTPAINLMGFNKEDVCEAQAWIRKLLNFSGHHIIENNHILYLGKKEHDIFSQLRITSNVSIVEIISSDKVKLEIKGTQTDLIEVVINIEHMLCEVQEEMARKKERDLWSLLGRWTDQQPRNQDVMKGNSHSIKFEKVLSTQALQDRKKQFEKCGLQVIKVEEIGNGVLEAVFQAKKKMMEGNTRKEPLSRMLFQRVPRQFCDMVCRVGFHRVYSGPCDSKYGVGIYFTKNLKTVADQIHKTTATDELIYVFEAEVLTGSFCQGCHTNIVPSPLSPGVIDSHDSVVDSVSSPETFVIFSGTQAVPKYLWTCTQVQVQSQNYSPKQMTLSPWSPKRSSIGSSVDDPHIK